MVLALVDRALLAAALPVLAGGGYLLALTLASRRALPPRYASAPIRFDLVVPAHDEEAGIAATVRSLLEVTYPEALRRVIVVADNCTDLTAERARGAGALVLVRDDPHRRGKGYALAFAFERSLADRFADAVVVVDADSVVSPNLLEAFASRLEAGAPAVQADNAVANPNDSWRTALMAIAFTSFNTVRSLGRDRLGLSVGLRGNGMCVATRTLRAVPHETFSVVEDLEYGIRLGLAGYRVHFAHEARVSSVMVSSADKARSQRLRWEGGRRRLARGHALALLGRGIARRSAVLLDLGLDLLVPPLAVLAGAAGAGLLASAAASRGAGRILPSTWAWGLCLAALAAHVFRGWWVSGTGLRGARALLHAPVYLAWKIGVALSGRGGAAEKWVRTEREAGVSVQTVVPAGVPAVDVPQLRRMWLALARQRWSSVAVIGVDPGIPVAVVAGALLQLPVPRDLGEFVVLDARGATPADVERLSSTLAEYAAKHVRVVVAVGDVSERMERMSIALLAEAVLVVVRIGGTHLAAAREMLELMGRERVVGCVALHLGSPLATEKPAAAAAFGPRVEPT